MTDPASGAADSRRTPGVSIESLLAPRDDGGAPIRSPRPRYSLLDSDDPVVRATVYYIDLPGWRTLVRVTQVADDQRCFRLVLVAESLSYDLDDMAIGSLYVVGDAIATAMRKHYGIEVTATYGHSADKGLYVGCVLCRGEPGVFKIAGVTMQGPAIGEEFLSRVGRVPWASERDRIAVFTEQRSVSLAFFENVWQREETFMHIHLPEAAVKAQESASPRIFPTHTMEK